MSLIIVLNWTSNGKIGISKNIFTDLEISYTNEESVFVYTDGEISITNLIVSDKSHLIIIFKTATKIILYTRSFLSISSI